MNLVRAMSPKTIIATLAAAACVGLAIFVVITSSKRALTSLEATLLQVVILGTGVSSTYFFSQTAARMAAKPHARSAFLRVASLYSGLFYIKRHIDRHRQSGSEAGSETIAVIEAVIDQHVRTVEHALEDWREIIPEEVAVLEKNLAKDTRVELEDLRR